MFIQILAVIVIYVIGVATGFALKVGIDYLMKEREENE